MTCSLLKLFAIGLGPNFDDVEVNGTIYDKENQSVFGDLGSNYIYRDTDGKILSFCECY
jgi:hypothetical protein